MLRRLKQLTLVILFFVLSAGCGHVPSMRVTIGPSKVEQQLIIENKAFQERMAALVKELESLETQYKLEYDKSTSLGTSNLWASLDTLYADPFKTKFTFAAIDGLNLAKAALPQPSSANYEKALSTQRDLLSEQATEIARGKKTIEQQAIEIAASQKAQEDISIAKDKIEKEKLNLEDTHGKKVLELKDAAIQDKDNALLQKQKEIDDKEAKDKAELQKLIVKILMVVGVVAGIISFVIKGPGQIINPLAAIASASAIGLAVGVSFLPTWMLIVSLSIVFFLVIATILYEVKRYRDIAKVGVGAIQERKNANPEEHKNLAPVLKSWTGGNQTLEKNIDKLAQELNVK